MMTLVRVLSTHWHAVERDLLSMGYRADDIGTPKLTLWELISIVVAAPVGTAVRYAEDGGWSRTDGLIANLAEQQAGVLQLTGRYPRPGVGVDQARTRSASSEFTPAYGAPFQPMDKEDFIAKRAAHFAKHKGHK